MEPRLTARTAGRAPQAATAWDANADAEIEIEMRFQTGRDGTERNGKPSCSNKRAIFIADSEIKTRGVAWSYVRLFVVIAHIACPPHEVPLLPCLPCPAPCRLSEMWQADRQRRSVQITIVGGFSYRTIAPPTIYDL